MFSLQGMILNVLYRPPGSSHTLADSKADLCAEHVHLRNEDWSKYKYDVDVNGKVNENFQKFESAIEGALDPSAPTHVDGNPHTRGEFSGFTYEVMGVRKWLAPALGFLGGVGTPERRRDVYRLLIAYVLDSRDCEKGSIYVDIPLSSAPRKPVAGDVPCACDHPACIAKKWAEIQLAKSPPKPKAEGAAKEKAAELPPEVPEKDKDKKDDENKNKDKSPGDPRAHLRSSVAIHALAAILRGIGFSVDQRAAAARVVLGKFAYELLTTSDWVDLAQKSLANVSVRSGIMPIQVCGFTNLPWFQSDIG